MEFFTKTRRRKYAFAFLAFVFIVAIIIISNNPIKVSRADSSGLSGYAWSSNIGWVSLSCADENVCSVSNYGVSIDPSSGNLSGYAWSSNIGWINFAPTGPYPENPQTSAVISMSTGIASGWMRALSYNKSYDDGWDGWIKITDATTTNGYLNGWAWGGLVVGWLNFQNVSVSGPVPPSPSSPVLTTITVSPSTVSIAVGSTTTFVAIGYDQNGNVTTTAPTWSSSSSTIATINASGIARGVSAGTVIITALDRGVAGTATLTVTSTASSHALVTLIVSPATSSVEVGGEAAFTAIGYDQNGNVVATSPTWSAGGFGDTGSVAINTPGVYTGGSIGKVTVIAADHGVSGTSTLTIVPLGSNPTSTPPGCTDCGGGQNPTSTPIMNIPGPCDFVANPSSITPPQKSTLSWACQNIDTCSIDQGIGGVSNLSGATSTAPSKTTTYTLTCNGSSGNATGTATVNVSTQSVHEVAP